MKKFLLKWTPRALAALAGGFYSLGLAYDLGLMIEIDRLAIKLIRPWLGHIGIGLFMPTFHWYAAWGVRCLAALLTGLIYDLLARLVRYLIKRWRQRKQQPIVPYGSQDTI